MSGNNGKQDAAPLKRSSGVQVNLKWAQESQLDLIGGENLDGSGFEDEEPEVESGQEG